MAWGRAHDLGPDELLPARKALEASVALGQTNEARHWAAECLRINALLRLDPLEQLSETEVARLKSLAEGG